VTDPILTSDRVAAPRSPRRPGGALPPPRWSDAQLDEARQRAIDDFRRERLQEPLAAYQAWLTQSRATMQNLLVRTNDLANIAEHAVVILSDRDLRDAFRYLAGPPISLDDLAVLAEADSLSPGRLRGDEALVQRVIGTVLAGLDRGRFPWVLEHRAPTQEERETAIVASAALRATQKVATSRRTEVKDAQEERVKAALRTRGFTEIARRPMHHIADAPQPGEFCGETIFATRNADIVAGLWDRRAMPIECKVSNSAVNSIKRVKNDVAAKATTWRTRFGEDNVVPVAVLGGVYDLPMLIDVQQRGLTLFWAHDLDAMMDWIARTRD
jgi:XamI-like restriction endonuclease